MSIEIDNNINTAQYSTATTTARMSTETNKILYTVNEEYDLWHDAVEIMDNYQEWTNPPTVLEDVDKPIIKPITGYQFKHFMFYKIIYFTI